MGFKVSRPEVIQNLVRFKESVSELYEKDQERSKDEEEHEDERKRKYKVLINRKTGDMRFAQKISRLESQIAEREHSNEELSEDFKEVEIIVTHTKGKPAQFKVTDSQNQKLGSDLDPVAIRIANETVDLLNQKVLEVKQTARFPEKDVLEDLSSIELSNNEQISDLPGWIGRVPRLKAEEMLEKSPRGTYVLREGDEITFATAFHLYQENHTFIHPYLLTVVESEDKISDFLLLKTDRGWCQYVDDPNLEDIELYSYVSTPKELIEKLSSIAKTPLKS